MFSSAKQARLPGTTNKTLVSSEDKNSQGSCPFAVIIISESDENQGTSMKVHQVLGLLGTLVRLLGNNSFFTHTRERVLL